MSISFPRIGAVIATKIDLLCDSILKIVARFEESTHDAQRLTRIGRQIFCNMANAMNVMTINPRLFIKNAPPISKNRVTLTPQSVTIAFLSPPRRLDVAPACRDATLLSRCRQI